MPLYPPQDFRKTSQTHRTGLRADQPAATDVLEGTLYFVEDEGVIERSDGSAWNPYSGSGGSGSSTPTYIVLGDGQDGEDGYVIPGPTGSAGPAGSTGSIGPIGPPGIDGDNGEDGYSIPGPQGIQGATGSTGPTGSIGPPGYDGNDGEDAPIIQGPQGVAGPTGSTGATGPAGPIGIPGQDGEDGNDSLVPGPIGPTGPTGATGNTGIGIPGVDGNDGEIWIISAPPPSPVLNLLKTTANQTINSGAGTFVDVTGLTFPVFNGRDYAFKFYIVFQSAATTTGFKTSVNCPTGTLNFFTTYQTVANSATAGVATWLQKHSVTRDDLTTLTTTITAAVDLVVLVEGRYLCTQDGTFAARFANELAANTDLTVRQGSWGMYW